MNSTNNYSVDLLEVLRNSVKPALGCTEPVAIGLAVAKAYEKIKGKVENIINYQLHLQKLLFKLNLLWQIYL